MSESQFDKEQRAFAALQGVMEQARNARELFDDAGLLMPSPLARILGETPAENGGVKGRGVPQMQAPPRPAMATDAWISVPISEIMATTLTKAIIRGRGGKSRPKDIVTDAQALRNDMLATVIYNVGPRLEAAKVITRGEAGWSLSDEAKAPIIHKSHVWGPPEVFQKQELACHRRQIIVHLLTIFSGGLQVMQLVTELANYSQCHAPVSKDLVKADMLALLEQKKVRRIGNSKKWVAVREGDT
jgi:hypothetical protein